MNAGLLEGTRVLDLSIWRPGPYATQLLVELGADVVKIEPPGGDPMRAFPPLFDVLNAGKRAAVVDLKEPSGLAAVLDLAAGADVVVECFRPGVVDRLGVGDGPVRERNPSVVYCSISGYGQVGPLRDLPGHDLNYQAWAGALEPRAGYDRPVVPRPPIADLAGGAYAALAVCAALTRRSLGGEGERIDVSMTDVLASWTGSVGPLSSEAGHRLAGLPGYGTFKTRDGGWIALGVLTEDEFWRSLAEVLGLVDVSGLGYEQRLAIGDELNRRVAERIGERRRDELVGQLSTAGVPVSPVLSQREMLEAEELRVRGTVFQGPGGEPLLRHPVVYRDHPARTGVGAPELGHRLPGWRTSGS